MRPMVGQAQGIPKLVPALMNPETRTGITVLHAALKVASWPPLAARAAKLLVRPPREPDLMRYCGGPTG